jgi:hypothetical protein
MKLHITCQYMENYGAHDWDGKGECPQHWKFKGGDEYFYPLGQFAPSDERIEELVQYFRPQIEWSDVGSKQYIVGYAVVEDSFLTEYERSQLEYDGAIAYPARILDVPEADVYYGA